MFELAADHLFHPTRVFIMVLKNVLTATNTILWQDTVFPSIKWSSLDLAWRQ
jgi:hypothetical protein